MIEPGGMGWVAVPSLPSISELHEALFSLVLPQLSLTFTNAILLTALLASDHFGERAAHVTPARLSVTSGLANTLLTPLGAFPMCHGAGGVTAHYRFGARSGGAPLMLGLLLLGLVVLPGNVGLTLLSSIPMAGLGALLLVTAWQLAITKRLFDCRASCVPVIVVTAALTVWVNPFWGLLAGGVTEWGRKMVLRRLSERTA
ncbi:putative sulfate/molybdate transporter [Vreelandella stevensii]|uniref:putative sulfate/molybdate transporter n=1 Tax=Vreelandella stevensii TaxID=502821 RepID=UPI00192CB319|nr:putative sulfate/molybdate transporter [Halomonas stevensii]